MKLAFVYDRVNKWGGVERVLLDLHQVWPEAPLYTGVYNPQTAKWAQVFKVKPSWLQKFPFAKSHHELYPWLTPLAFESFDFSEFDVVVSITSAEAKGIVTKPSVLHLCYCLTPTRYLWSHEKQYQDQPGLGLLSGLGKATFKILKKPMKKWDLVASSRPDHYIAISQTVKKRIKKYYDRESWVIYPGIDIKKFSPNSQNPKTQKYLLVVSRLVPYKNIDLAIRVANHLKKRLVVVGSGKDKRRLKKLAGPTVEFVGNLTDKRLISYYQNCQAVLVTGKEDFGLVSLEAQASGRPVVALKAGGVLETVVEGKTGIFFEKATVESLKKAVLKLETTQINAQKCLQNAKKFDKKRFKTKFKKRVEALWQKHQS